MQRKILPLFAATIATTIYGLNHTIAKMVMPIYIGSLGLVLLRVLGATIIFWIISLFFKSKPIEKKDRFIYPIRNFHGKLPRYGHFRFLDSDLHLTRGVYLKSTGQC